jgi:hypothetical protein
LATVRACPPRRARRDRKAGRCRSSRPGSAKSPSSWAGGQTNAQIAARLQLSERTVEKHVSNALGKLGVASRTGVVRLLAAERRAGAGAATGT